jgi:GT2 family glycosyltransferase
LFASVIVPTRHRPELLERCLERLAPSAQGISADSYEVIVSDDGSSPSAKPIVDRFEFARWTKGPARGPATNRNHGASEARGEWLLFTDDDCLPDPGWIAAFQRAAIGEADTRVFEGRTYADRPRQSIEETAPLNESGGVLWACNLAIRKDVFDAVGQFDQRFPYAAIEDIEFRIRLGKRGVGWTFVPEAAVCHPWRPADKTWAACNHFCESFEILLDIHPDELSQYPPGRMLRHLLSGLVRETGPQLLRSRSGFRVAFMRHTGELRLEGIVLKRHLARLFAVLTHRTSRR